MKKIIRAARDIETITKELDAIRDTISKKKEAYDRDYKNYKKAMREVFQKTEDKVLKEIGETSIPLEVDVSSSRYLDGLEVKITNGDNPYNGQSLNWRMNIEVEDDEVKKESSSWSGLNATTKEHIDNLKENVDVLERINEIDWKSILSDDVPNIDEYMSGDYFTKDDKEVEQSLQAELEEAEEENAI